MKALGLVVPDKKVFFNFIFKPFLSYNLHNNYVTNQKHLNNFSRGPHKDHSCEVWFREDDKVKMLTQDEQQTTDKGQSQ